MILSYSTGWCQTCGAYALALVGTTDDWRCSYCGSSYLATDDGYDVVDPGWPPDVRDQGRADHMSRPSWDD